ncbi:hypothetical protein V2J09_007511 [Rumex salicifolius]
MADPNLCSSFAPPPNGCTLNSQEISDLLHAFLQSSSLPSPQNSQLQHHRQPAPEISESVGLIDSSSNLNLYFPSDSWAPGETDRTGFTFSGAIATSVDRIDDFDSDSERDHGASEVPRNSAPSKSSIKRTRVAEFHNLSEKKRRQKINDNLRALQKFIPNSNKTDKASMLDDAIDYLRHLQSQVQMLAIRNGSSLHPCYMTELHSAQQTPARINYNEEDEVSCISRGVGSGYGNQEFAMTVYDPDQYSFSDGKTLIPSGIETSKSAHSFSLDPSTSAHYP